MMARRDTVGSNRWPSNADSDNEDRPQLILCVDRLQPQIHEVWTFGDDGVTHEVHPTARIDVSTGFFGELATNYLTPSWRRFPMFGRIPINGSVKILGVPDFLWNDRMPWNLNLLDPYDGWGCRVCSTNQNWVSQSGGGSEMEFSCLCPSILPPNDL